MSFGFPMKTEIITLSLIVYIDDGSGSGYDAFVDPLPAKDS
jgi:hypothetical protein